MKTKVIVETQAFDQWMQEQQVASNDSLNQAVAVNPADLSTAEFLAPYTSGMGIQSETLELTATITIRYWKRQSKHLPPYYASSSRGTLRFAVLYGGKRHFLYVGELMFRVALRETSAPVSPPTVAPPCLGLSHRTGLPLPLPF